MSLINDALKRARQAPPRLPPTQPPLRPVAAPPVSVSLWLVPAIIVILMVAAIFLLGGAWAHHPAQRGDAGSAKVSAPAVPNVSNMPNVPATPAAPASPVAPVASATPAVVDSPPPASNPPPPQPLSPPTLPLLQGIIYTPAQPSAIVNGQTVRPGDQVGSYQVKEISPSSVTLIRADQTEIKLNLGR